VLRLGTRASALARAQAELVRRALEARHPGVAVELVLIRTSGDRAGRGPLPPAGLKGLFVKEIEEALLGGLIEIAVHSLKDLPAGIPEGLTLAAFPAREDPRDVLVSRGGGGLAVLPRGARVGTSSLRRRVQLLGRRPDLTIEPLRGNVDTRLRKLDSVPLDALVLAAAGLRRLGLDVPGAHYLSPDEMLPAVGQGTLAVEIRVDDAATGRLVAALDHAETRAAAVAERTVLEGLGGSCTTPIAAFARRQDGGLCLSAFVATPDGSRVLRHTETSSRGTPADLGRLVAEQMLAKGAGEIVAAANTV
jgi:hydroxymethylbilane synthase